VRVPAIRQALAVTFLLVHAVPVIVSGDRRRVFELDVLTKGHVSAGPPGSIQRAKALIAMLGTP
jgi:hypothetical protein